MALFAYFAPEIGQSYVCSKVTRAVLTPLQFTHLEKSPLALEKTKGCGCGISCVVKDVRALNSVKVSNIFQHILYPFSFHSEGEIVRWSIDGSKFIVQSGSTIDLYSTVAISFKSITQVHQVTSWCRKWIYCFQSNILLGCTMSCSVNAFMGKGR